MLDEANYCRMLANTQTAEVLRTSLNILKARRLVYIRRAPDARIYFTMRMAARFHVCSVMKGR